MDPLGNRRVPSPAEVERQLTRFWRDASNDEQPVTRACSMNLVAICADREDELRRTTELIATIAETVPGRALVVAPPSADATGLAVYVSAHCHRGAGGTQVCSEQVTIQPGPSGLELVPGTVLQLLVEDMPVYTWWRRKELGPASLLDPLVALSDYWVLDSARAARPAAHLETMHGLASRGAWPGHAIDAAWARLSPWREEIASCFDDPALRPALDRVTRVEVESAEPVEAAYLAGWLASRLGFRRDGDGWIRRDGAAVEISRTSSGDGCCGIAAVRLEAETPDTVVILRACGAGSGKDCLSLSVTVEGRDAGAYLTELPSLDEAETICGLLQRTGDDPVFEAALPFAARLL